MADLDMKGSKMLEGSEPVLKRLENLFARLVQESSEIKQEMGEIKREISENKQETSAIVMQMDLMREEMLAAVWEARQFTVEHGKRLHQDLTEEFKEKLVEGRH
ncbi:hypothetical protein E2C01_044012 [Portunus trituberculatus]|uniref:Uncharacterized protein n=1 Tax=Portunus trituberculatus TaxID=210409 RepID=A0A5B7FY99_PORTR|nr:hypothetical protein [Portunus trituberculatus]